MFGVDNTGVINQRQSPAIWQSDIADFPPNYILGRILIDSFFGGIYIDTASTRLQISNGSKNFTNGIANYGGIPTNNNIGLGGDMSIDTEINMLAQTISFIGSIYTTVIKSEGYLFDDSNGWAIPSMDEGTFGPVDANTVISFYNPATGKFYDVLAKGL